MVGENLRSRSNRRRKKRQNNRNLMIVLALAFLFFTILLAAIVLNKNDDSEVQQEESTEEEQVSETEKDTSDNESDSIENKEENDSDDSSDNKSDEEKEEAEKEDEDEDEEESSVSIRELDPEEIESSNVLKAYEGDWKPVGTSQAGEHTTNYQNGSEDRMEIKRAVSAVTDVPEGDMVEWRVENGGDQKVISTVSDSNEEEYFRVYLIWVDNEGWQVDKLEHLKENDKK